MTELVNTDESRRLTVEERLLEIRLSRKKHLIVEGNSDQRFYQSWFSMLGRGDDLVVSSVDEIDVSRESIESLGVTVGNRGAVVSFAHAASGSNETPAFSSKIRCIIDRDLGQELNIECGNFLLVTDFPALESYAMTREVLEAANLLGFCRAIPDIDAAFEGLKYALGALFAVRLQYPHLPRPRYEKGIKASSSRDLREFDVKVSVDASIVDMDETDWTVRSERRGEDCRTFAYGHDISELLLAAYSNRFKNKSGITKIEVIEEAMLSAMMRVGEFESRPLFVAVKSWVHAP
ncbi:hypothetical protein [Brevibacterium album]|uniref:hypothetical protein n=1 Tax=Brevibacterium album TaxID=417948 RepID=UPI0012EB6D91|nr:hypothetical protein [Brevibacterium album]